MSKEIKNKFDNFEVKPPDYILENLKTDLGFAKQSFLVKHKYSIAASVVGVVIALFILTNNESNTKITNNSNPEKTEIQTTITNNKTEKSEREEVKITSNNITNNKIPEDKNITPNKPETQNNNKLNKINKSLISNVNINKISAGNNISICGTECKLGENSTAKTGNWLVNNNIEFSDINKPNADIKSNSFGKQILVWSEKTVNGFILDTIIVEFKELPSTLKIEQVNEHCGRSDAIVEFITKDGNYKYKWSDNITSSNPVRKNLTTGNYNIIVSNENGCNYNYSIEIKNTEIVNVDFYHTELYSAINSPIYFTDRSKVKGIDQNELKYEWDFGDGITSNKIHPEHEYNNAGEYEVTLKVSTKTGCSNSYKSSISIDEDMNVLPNIFTPNGDGIHDILVINPKPLKNYKALIFNKAGQKVYEWDNQYEGWDGNLKNGEQASEGIYYYVVTGIDSDGKKSQYRSFIHLTR